MKSFTLNFKISGITCEACTRLINSIVSEIDGVKSVDVSLQGKATLSASRSVAISEIINALKGTEYGVTV